MTSLGSADRQAALLTLLRSSAGIELAKGALGAQYGLSMDEAGVLLVLLAGARRLPLDQAARAIIQEASGHPGRPAA